MLKLYTATPVVCGWAGAVIELKKAFGQEQWAQKLKNAKKVEGTNRHGGVWSRVAN